MMTLLAPLFFYVALGVVAATVALHLIVTRQPTSSPLPTARFVPRGSVRVTTVSRPRDLLLLALRMLAVLLIGLAFARPAMVPERRAVARVVLADVSRSVADIGEVRDSAAVLLRAGDVLVPYDLNARAIHDAAADSAAGLERSDGKARLSSGLIVALRSAAELRDEADSVELAIVSPFRAAALDDATHEVRDLWPGRIRVVPVAARADSLAPPGGLVVVGASEDDGVALAVALAGLDDGDAVRIARGTAGDDAGWAEDSAWAAAGARTLVRWPAEGAPPGWHARTRPDTTGAVVAGEAVLVYPLERRWHLDASDDSPVVARWVDGEPAAVERVVGVGGCIRDVAVPVPERGDVMLRPSFARLVTALGAPCLAATGGTGMDADALAALAGDGPLASREDIAAPEVVATPLVPWLLAAALALVLLELWVRRGRRAAATDDAQGADDAADDADARAPAVAQGAGA